MTFEMLHLRQLIDQAIHQEPAPSQIKARIEESETEKERILMAIENALLASGPEKTSFYLNQCQQPLILMINDLEKEISTLPQASLSPARTQLLSVYQSALDDLLTALERQFPEHFNLDCKLPHPANKAFRDHLKDQFNHLLTILKNNEANAELQKSFASITEELQKGDSHYNFRQVNYLGELLNLLQQKISGFNPDNTTLDLIVLLISADFNHPCFYHFCCSYISSEIEQCDHLAQQYRILNYLKKTIQQIFKVIPFPYSASFSKIDAALLRYIEAETAYLQSVDIVAADLTLTGQMPKTYQVTFTVRQLAIFIHLQVEAGIIVGESPKSIRQYITSTYSTVEKAQISEKSFKNAYYANSGNDIKKVMEKLTTMLALARARY